MRLGDYIEETLQAGWPTYVVDSLPMKQEEVLVWPGKLWMVSSPADVQIIPATVAWAKAWAIVESGPAL